MARNTDNPAPVWMKRVLLAAAAYNIVWGLVVLAAPNALFTLTGMEPPTYPMIFQCVGMIVGVYGVGYGIAAFNPARHWPIVLVGFLGKIFGPIGFLGAALTGELPWAFGLTIITNDLIWWLPFALILMFAWRTNTAPSGDAMAFDDAVAAAVDQNGTSLLDQSRVTPRLVVFLRHAGCTFCREALHDIGERRSAIESAGVTPVLVHMGPEDERTRAVVSRYGLEDLPRISDPARALYPRVRAGSRRDERAVRAEGVDRGGPGDAPRAPDRTARRRRIPDARRLPVQKRAHRAVVPARASFGPPRLRRIGVRDGMSDAILIAHLLSTVLMTGLIWFVQLVHYPLFARVGAEAFIEYEREHQRRTTWIVAPLMLTELVTAVIIAFSTAYSDARAIAVAGLVLALLIWLSTMFLQVPMHRRLANGQNDRAVVTLVRSNWIRTALWTARSVVACLLLFG